MTKYFFFLGGGVTLTCSRYRLRYFFVHNSFKKKDGSTRYTHIKAGQTEEYFINSVNSCGEKCIQIRYAIRLTFSGQYFCKVWGCLFRQVIGTNCAPLLVDLFSCLYESEFLDTLVRSGHRKLAWSFNICYRYINDLIVFNNKMFTDICQRHLPIWTECLVCLKGE